MPYSIRTAIPPGTTSGPELADIVEEVGDLTQIVVLSDTTNQPGSPTEGDAYIVNGDVSWGGAQYDIAVFRDTTWIYHTPEAGWVAYIIDRGEARRFNGTDWNTRIPDSSPEHATDGGTDAYASATNTDAPKDGDTITRDFQSANTTTTPTLGSLTITTKDGSALWAGALSGVHELQLASGGGSWLVLDPNPTNSASETATDATPKLESYGISTGELSGTGIPGAIGRGAIVESGSNSNGSYIRWANGEQVCFHLANDTKDVDNSAGNIFFSDESTWTFPAAFVDSAVRCFAQETTTSASWAQARGKTATTLNWNIMGGSSNAGLSVSVSLYAIGYWK